MEIGFMEYMMFYLNDGLLKHISNNPPAQGIVFGFYIVPFSHVNTS